MSDTVHEHKIDALRVQEGYNAIIEALTLMDVNRAEAVTALVCVLGTQYNGQILEPPEMQRFVVCIGDWLTAYFIKGKPE